MGEVGLGNRTRGGALFVVPQFRAPSGGLFVAPDKNLYCFLLVS